jgi:hypothetical protein
MSFKTFFEAIGHWFASPKGQEIIKQIGSITIEAEPIVQEIALATSNRTFASISEAYQKYAVPLPESELIDPRAQALALRDLATTILKKNHQDASTNILNSAVEIALAHVKSKSSEQTSTSES